MRLRTLVLATITLSLGTLTINTQAAPTQAEQDEAVVVGACMVQAFIDHTPPVEKEKIEKCANVAADKVPKCLGLSDEEYTNTIKSCLTQLNNAKCVSKKMNVPLIKYADCGYEKNPTACYKALGYTFEKIKQFSADCDKAPENTNKSS